MSFTRLPGWYGGPARWPSANTARRTTTTTMMMILMMTMMTKTMTTTISMGIIIITNDNDNNKNNNNDINPSFVNSLAPLPLQNLARFSPISYSIIFLILNCFSMFTSARAYTRTAQERFFNRVVRPDLFQLRVWGRCRPKSSNEVRAANLFS